MDRPLRLPLTLSIVAILAAFAAPLHAADWPTRPVTVIVPFGAGGNTDMMARLGAQHLTAKLGQTFVVENRPGAGGALGTGQVATAAPDGYTLLFSASANINLTPQVQKLTFDPVKQLVPITNMGTGTQMIAIKRELPVKTLPEFIAYAKANPGKLNFTVAGTQNISHLAPVLLFARAGIDLVMIPAKSRAAGGVRSDVRSGRSLFRQFVRAAAAHQQRQDQADRRRHGARLSSARRTSRRSPKRCRVSSSRPGTASRLRPARPSRSSRRSGTKSRRSPNRLRCPNA